MIVNMLNSIPALAEIFVLVMACIVLLASAFIPKKENAWIIYIITQLGIIGAFFLTLFTFPTQDVVAYAGQYLNDPFAALLKLFIYVITFMAFAYSRPYIAIRKIADGEYYTLGLFALLGMQVLVSANSLLTVFLGLELLSLPLYAMVALRRDDPDCTEAAMKYFVTGSLATGMMLYGMSMLYGATQTLDIHGIADAILDLSGQQDLVLILGLVFLLSGVIFKLGAAPFHPWVPDVYQGAPTSVTLFIGSATKIAALGFLFRVVIQAMPSLVMQWQKIFIVVAIVSMGLGNIAAIMQTNVKRMLAYSAIAHMGYMTLGLIAANPTGYAAATFYMFAYALMSLGAFGILVLMSHSGFEAENLSDLRGLNTRSPWLAFMMLLIMFSMAGIPPTIGFFAKLGVLEALIGVHLVWLATLALVFAIIGAYYYLSVVKTMYFEEPDELGPFKVNPGSQFVISVNGIAVLALGMFPSSIINFCHQVFQIN